MHEEVVSRNTPILSHHLLMTQSLIRQKVRFWTSNGINEQMYSRNTVTRQDPNLEHPGPYSPTIPKNILCLFLQDLHIGM